MIEFRRNKETGILEVWKNGKNIGVVKTMGDSVSDTSNKKKQSETTQDNNKIMTFNRRKH